MCERRRGVALRDAAIPVRRPVPGKTGPVFGPLAPIAGLLGLLVRTAVQE